MFSLFNHWQGFLGVEYFAGSLVFYLVTISVIFQFKHFPRPANRVLCFHYGYRWLTDLVYIFTLMFLLALASVPVSYLCTRGTES